ncbi:hypothetical protein EDB85DRAFT_547944 [Lactarius pseudohatsudake]|nr:hypothetical protein EDB85DRAFT_547944 [Lactarius pseudohatsudake]
MGAMPTTCRLLPTLLRSVTRWQPLCVFRCFLLFGMLSVRELGQRHRRPRKRHEKVTVRANGGEGLPARYFQPSIPKMLSRRSDARPSPQPVPLPAPRLPRLGRARRSRQSSVTTTTTTGGKATRLSFMLTTTLLALSCFEIQGASNLPRWNMTRTGWDMDPFVVVSFGKKVYALCHINPHWQWQQGSRDTPKTPGNKA